MMNQVSDKAVIQKRKGKFKWYVRKIFSKYMSLSDAVNKIHGGSASKIRSIYIFFSLYKLYYKLQTRL